MKRKVSIATGILQRKYGDAQALKIAKEIGADGVDFDLTMYSKNRNSIYDKSNEEIIAYFTELRALADELGLEIGQTHGRIVGFKNKLEEDDRLIEEAAIDCMVTAILGAKCCIIHSVTSIFMGPDAPAELMHRLNFDMFCRMVPFAKQYGIKIASETFGDAVQFDACDFFGNIGEFLKSYNRVCAVEDFANYMCVCVDTGHSNKASRFNNNPTPGDVIRMLGGHVQVLHLNDNDKLTDQHKIPMTGTIDWEDVFNALDEVGYTGVYNMELELRHFGEDFCIEEAAFAIKVMRQLLKTRYGE